MEDVIFKHLVSRSGSSESLLMNPVENENENENEERSAKSQMSRIEVEDLRVSRKVAPAVSIPCSPASTPLQSSRMA